MRTFINNTGRTIRFRDPTIHPTAFDAIARAAYPLRVEKAEHQFRVLDAKGLTHVDIAPGEVVAIADGDNEFMGHTVEDLLIAGLSEGI